MSCDANARMEDVIEGFEQHCRSLGLDVRRATLKKFPGCVHWHLTKPREKGTLEATYWPGKRIWLSVHGNRRADWQEDVVQTILSRRGAK